jgi:metal-dependent HD superfamily phosphatase/phosphodiesterase
MAEKNDVIYPLRLPRSLKNILKRVASKREQKFGRRVTVRSIILDALLSHDREVNQLFLMEQDKERKR